ETDIKSGDDLLKVVGGNKDKELSVNIYREGKPQMIKLTPARRPQDQVTPPPAPALEAKPAEAMEKALKLWKQHAGPLEFDMLQPGVVVRMEPPTLPDDMEIMVKREGKKPAQITVKQGDNSWGASEKEIDTLPEAAQAAARA